MTAYYNEFDPYAAQWLRNLIEAGHIAPGIVDERSIEDVTPKDLEGFTQCHFFAGVGVWSLALRRAGWPDSRPVWTASCPCQPFSAAGVGAAFEDARHLWPSLAWLIGECKPAIVIGEQVASKAVEPWVDLVHADMEALGYAFGAVPFPSAGVGAPHIRDRLYWLAHADDQCEEPSGHAARAGHVSGMRAALSGVDDADNSGLQGFAGHGGATGRTRPNRPVASTGVPSSVADADADGLRFESASFSGAHHEKYNPEPRSNIGRAGPTNGLWGSADWLHCRDGKWRAVEPGTFPLANGAAARVGRLRAYGNAVNAEAARIFIECII